MCQTSQLPEAAGTMGAIGGGFVPLLIREQGQNGGEVTRGKGQDRAQQQTDLAEAETERRSGREQVSQEGGRLQTGRGGEQQGRA